MKTLVGPNERGLTYKLDLLDGSRMLTTVQGNQGSQLPIVPASYGYFVAGSEHYTEREGGRRLHQVFLTHKGCGRVAVDGQVIMAKENTVLLLDLDMPHRYETVGNLWEHEWVNFSGTGCKAYASLINGGGIKAYPVGADREISLLMREIEGGMVTSDMVGFVHSSTRIIRLLDAIYTLITQTERAKMADLKTNIMHSIQYIENNYPEEVTLEILADNAFLSKFYYSRIFRKYMGVTPYEYLNSVRLGHAKHLLLTTALTVEEIGWRVGFSGSKNLIRQFKKVTGITPGEFRRRGGA